MNDKLNLKILELENEYSNKAKSIPFDFREFVKKDLKISRSDVYTHNIHTYPGRLFPYIPIFFLSTDRFCPSGGKVLDVFCGSGTVLLESIVNPFHKRNVWGIEINPLGRLISKVKTTPLDPHKLRNNIGQLFRSLRSYNKSGSKQGFVPSFPNIDIWFSQPAIKGLSILHRAIRQIEGDDFRDFFWVCFSRLIRMVSKADPYIPPPVLLKIDKYSHSYRYCKLKDFKRCSEEPDIESMFKSVVEQNYDRIKSLWELESIREGKIKAAIICSDVRNINKGHYTSKGAVDMAQVDCVDDSVSIIITSPPYLAAQKYVRSTKLELFWLGIATADDLQTLDRCTIGTERVSLRSDAAEIGVDSIDSVLEIIGTLSKERMLITYEYFKNMKIALYECYRILEHKGYMILIIGNNNICGLKIETAELLNDLAQSIGFTQALVLQDEIRGRGMITKRHDTGGLIKEEFAIVLKKDKQGTRK